MRCKKHPADTSSAVGVCSSCLRERLFAIMAAQAQKESHLLLQDRRKLDNHQQQQQPPPPSFPRSVSPYISRGKSDTSAATWQLDDHRRRFYSTPQVGPSGGSAAVEIKKKKKSGGGRFSSLFLGIFRSKSDKPDLESSGPISDPGVSSIGSPSWFSTMIRGRRKKQIQIRTFSLEETAIGNQRRACRGMSPARCSDEEDDEHCRDGSSGYSSESSDVWRQTPRRTPAAARRGGGGRVAAGNISGLAFCLSPLVRASPNRRWNQKVAPPEAASAGEYRVPTKPYLSTTTSFCKNRSRKLADFGRYNYSTNH